jgi:uncharacterized membrane protein
MKSNIKELCILFGIWIIAILVIYTGMRPFGLGDGTNELWRIGYTNQYGWDITAKDQNNTSIALNLIAPFIIKTFSITPLDVYRNIYPFIYALTPVFLYLIFRRVMTTFRAVLCASFFIVMPTTYQEIPNIAKSMIAQPLAASVLFVVLGGYSYKVKAAIGIPLIIATTTAHYTIGIMLIAWLGISALINAITYKKRKLLVIVTIAGLFSLAYLVFAGGGAVVRSIANLDKVGEEKADAIVNIIKGETIETYSSSPDYELNSTATKAEMETVAAKVLNLHHPLRLPFKYSSYWINVIIYLATTVLLIGSLYWIMSTEFLVKHTELTAIIIFSGLTVMCVLYIPFLTRVIFVSRWIQIASISMCGLYGAATYWLPRKFSYPIAIVVLIGLLTIAR